MCIDGKEIDTYDSLTLYICTCVTAYIYVDTQTHVYIYIERVSRDAFIYANNQTSVLYDVHLFVYIFMT